MTQKFARTLSWPLFFGCALLLFVVGVSDYANAAPFQAAAKIKPADLECVSRGGQSLVGRKDRARVWGRALRTKVALRLELKQLSAKLTKIRGKSARNFKLKKQDLTILLAMFKECNRNIPQESPLTPTPLTIPEPVGGNPTPIAPGATATPSPTATETPTPTATLIPTKVPVLIAQGHAGRLIMSCDDGQTWIQNTDQAVSPAVRCWNTARITTAAGIEVNGCTETPNTNDTCDDCDHQNWAGRGLAYGDGAFIATWGWGKPGKVQRSTDGVHWTTVINATTNASVRFGDGVFMTGRTLPYHSQDNGLTWNEVSQPPGYNPWYNSRGIGYGASPQGGNFFIFGDGDRLNRVAPAGNTIVTPLYDQGCGSGIQGSASSNTIFVTTNIDYTDLQNPQPFTCRSADGGATFQRQNLPIGRIVGQVLWTGTQFIFWDDEARVYRSPNGLNWIIQNGGKTNFTQFPRYRVTERSGAGTFVMVGADWGQWYEQQRFFRSTDGVNWTQLAPGAYVGSHPINHITFGYVDAVPGGCG